MSNSNHSDDKVFGWWVPMLWIIGAASVAVVAAMVGANLVVDRPRSILYDDIEPLYEGVAGVDRLTPRRLPGCHYRMTTLHGEVSKVERIGAWKVERGVDDWRVLELHRDAAGVVERIDILDGAGTKIATEEIRREGSTVFVRSGAGVEERDLDEEGRIKRIRERGTDGKITAAASLARDDQGRIIRRTQHLGSGRIAYDAHYAYEDGRYPNRVTTETVRRGACPVRTTRFDDAGRREEVRCADAEGSLKVDSASGCEVIRYTYLPGERRHVCVVGEVVTPGESVTY